MDYPLHQFRLIGRYADAIVEFVASNRMIKLWSDNIAKIAEPGNTRTELNHALSSCCKAFSSWRSIETLQECRKSMGGMGYSYYALIGMITQNGDVNQTFEGDNNILIMQTAKFLLKNYQSMKAGKQVAETLEFLKMKDHKYDAEDKYTTPNLKGLIYQRAKDRIISTCEELTADMSKWDDLQAIYVKDMCEAYYMAFITKTFEPFLASIKDKSTNAVFDRLFGLFLRTKIIKDGGYYRKYLDQAAFDQMKDEVLDLLGDLRPDTIALTDILPLPNRMLGAFGNSDLDIYNRLWNHLYTQKGARERANWWRLMYTNEHKQV